MSETVGSASKLPVLIVGAGIGGLTLAHGLRKNSIPFMIFERDPSSYSRLQGWGITIHWALSHLHSVLPDSISARLNLTQVDPAQGERDNGNFLFFDLSNCQVKWRIPPAERRRVSRNRFRNLLLEEGMADKVLWGKKLISFAPTEVGAKALFDDGSEYEGLLIVGVDGAASRARSLVAPLGTADLTPLQVRFFGVSIDVTREQVQPLLELDPLLFQGCHPNTGTFMWFSVLDTPETNGTMAEPLGRQKWTIQLNLSWPATSPDDIPPTDGERIIKMRELTADFAPKLKKIFHEILPLDHSPVTVIKLADWLPPLGPWDNFDGRITLAGDAAHAMTMYRGEGFNHAILDIHNILIALGRIYSRPITGPISAAELSRIRKAAIADYETEVRERGREAVLLSRAACLEAHRWDALNEHSAVLKRRTR